jgi:hypothetical protein
VTDFQITKYLGDAVARISRLLYEIGGEVTSNPADGAVEIVFAGGGVLFCDTGPDGDSLQLQDFAWTDPLAEPLSPENEEFVRTSGKWVRHDVSTEPPFADLIGEKLFDIALMVGSTGRLHGLLLDVSGPKFLIYAIADEVHVSNLI